MNDSLNQSLAQGLERMGLQLSSSAQQQLIDYIRLIAHWNRAFNLTAIREVEEMVSKHLLDSLAVLPFLSGYHVLDVGSGAGLPGIPLAIASPSRRFVLIDSNGKKTRFLTQVKIALQLPNVEVVNQRVEDYFPESDGHRIYFDVIIARAYAACDEILRHTAHLQSEATRILLMQGKPDDRISSNNHECVATHTLYVYGLEAERHLLEIRKIG